MAIYNTSLSPIQLPGYTYPQWSVGVGWFIRMTSMICIPLYIIYLIATTPGTIKQVRYFS